MNSGPGSGSSAPGGNDPRKPGPNRPPGANDGGDGSSKENATWVAGTPEEVRKGRHYIVNRMGTWVRCSFNHALMDSTAGFPVYASWNGRRVRFRWNGPGPAQYQAFEYQNWQIVQEEEDRIARHEPLASENLAEEAEAEFEADGDTVFDSVQQMPSTPPTSSYGNVFSSSLSGGRGRTNTSTPRGPSSGNQPQSGSTTITPRGGGSGSSGRPHAGREYPTSPSAGKGKGKGPARAPDSGSPGAGAA
ncbi:hypothetical protein ACJQWK_04669 [Exserohilum turcicum]|uniref:Uncharacterized protein n=1 Tax=Exserohilum turcicum (strain 28A) TaxID=671987 RepID=R0IBX9_EXST2|nr:uncharacterized protein SETTUDRAFT_34258 [Exserohilum turcica Et28A]EOA82721.1 hypothetical protein SETTUDRAFT_34258 [Exserohilum turcica Et28A]